MADNIIQLSDYRKPVRKVKRQSFIERLAGAPPTFHNSHEDMINTLRDIVLTQKGIGKDGAK